MAAINNWPSKLEDFIQAYPQAPIKYVLYMELPKGFNTKEGYGRTYFLEILNNIY